MEWYNSTIVAAIYTYIADQARDWDLYKDGLKYAYDCQPNASTSVALFKIVPSKHPGNLAVKSMKSTSEPQGTFKRKWNDWLVDTILKTKQGLDRTGALYKKNFDKHLRKQPEVIN